MRSISESLSAGITGATMTMAGMPASASCLIASSRFGGVEARGSMVRASFGSRVVTDNATLTRSEEHTSELQSQSNLVCRLLLEKKKKVARAHDRRPSVVGSSCTAEL